MAPFFRGHSKSFSGVVTVVKLFLGMGFQTLDIDDPNSKIGPHAPNGTGICSQNYNTNENHMASFEHLLDKKSAF